MTWKRFFWYFKNDDDPVPPDGYLKDRPQWWRVFCWHLRNPMHNPFHYVIGFKGEDFTTEYSPPKDKWHDKWVIGGGKGRMVHTVPSRNKKYRFTCNRGKKWEWYFGFDQRGAFGMAFRNAHAVDAGDM